MSANSVRFDQETIDYYEEAAPRYTISTALDRHRDLDPFLDRLPDGAYVLEVGCGNGRDASHMLERGFRVDATDGTAAMVRKANQAFGVNARQMRFDQLEAEAEYDAVWAHACLLHLPRSGLPDALFRIHRALKSGGLHFANFKLRDEAHPEEGRDPLGRWTNLPGPDLLHSLYTDANFTLLDTQHYPGNGSDGVVRNWLALTVRKP